MYVIAETYRDEPGRFEALVERVEIRVGQVERESDEVLRVLGTPDPLVVRWTPPPARRRRRARRRVDDARNEGPIDARGPAFHLPRERVGRRAQHHGSPTGSGTSRQRIENDAPGMVTGATLDWE